jgi:hypothetical protein
VIGFNVVGQYLYAAVLTEGLIVLDVGDPAHPFRVGQTPINGTTLSVQVAGDYAYLSVRPHDASGNLQIVNVRDPFQPFRVGGYDAAAVPRDLFIGDGYACVLSSKWTGVRNVGVMETIDVLNPWA